LPQSVAQDDLFLYFGIRVKRPDAAGIARHSAAATLGHQASHYVAALDFEMHPDIKNIVTICTPICYRITGSRSWAWDFLQEQPLQGLFQFIGGAFT
jgi:hypothetical protein